MRPDFCKLADASFFTFLLITQDLNKQTKNPEHHFIDITIIS